MRGNQITAMNLDTGRVLIRHANHFKRYLTDDPVPPLQHDKDDDDFYDSDEDYAPNPRYADRSSSSSDDDDDQQPPPNNARNAAQAVRQPQQAQQQPQQVQPQQVQPPAQQRQQGRPAAADANNAARRNRRNQLDFSDDDDVRPFNRDDPPNTRLMRSQGAAPDLPHVLPTAIVRNPTLQRQLADAHQQHQQQRQLPQQLPQQQLPQQQQNNDQLQRPNINEID